MLRSPRPALPRYSLSVGPGASSFWKVSTQNGAEGKTAILNHNGSSAIFTFGIRLLTSPPPPVLLLAIRRSMLSDRWKCPQFYWCTPGLRVTGKNEHAPIVLTVLVKPTLTRHGIQGSAPQPSIEVVEVAGDLKPAAAGRGTEHIIQLDGFSAIAAHRLSARQMQRLRADPLPGIGQLPSRGRRLLRRPLYFRN